MFYVITKMFCGTTRIVNEEIAKIAAKCIFAKYRTCNITFSNSDYDLLVQLSNLTHNSDKINKNFQNICIFREIFCDRRYNMQYTK